MARRGVCRNAGCENARTGSFVDLYPGPGEYCPECGERLELSPLEMLPTFDRGSWPAAPPWRARVRRTIAVIAGVVLVVVASVVVVDVGRVAMRLVANRSPFDAQARRANAHAQPTSSGIARIRTPTRAASHSVARLALPAPTTASSAIPEALPPPSPSSAAVPRTAPAERAPPIAVSPSATVAPPSAAPRAAEAIAVRPADTPTPEPPQAAASEPSHVPSTPSCARADVPPTMVRAAVPDMPAMAQQLGVSGTVQVVVSLNAQSRVVATRVQSSPSGALNFAALTAARNSQFHTQIRNCEAVAADYVLNVTFQ